MKNYKVVITLFMGLLVLMLNGFTFMQDENKKAILFVSFGTTYKENKTITIDALKEKITQKYKAQGYDVKLAFTSRQVIRKIYKRDGIRIDTPEEALNKLKSDGYGTVIVQATHIINGVEADYLKDEVKEMKDDFHVLKLGDPLLTHVKDYNKTLNALKDQIGVLKKDEAVILIGHGTHHPATSAYAMMDYVFKTNNYKNVYLSTVEGFPSYEDVLSKLKTKKIKSITLMPFMFVAGDHANNDIAGDEKDSWKQRLKKDGFEVNTYLHGLGENRAIQEIFIDHINHAIEKKEVDMKRKKAGFALDS